MGLNVRAVGPPNGIGRDFGHERSDRSQLHVPRPQQPDEGLGKVLIFDDNGALMLPQCSPQLRLARDSDGR
jgi:hypothetical protein